ncbi:MAG: hypothetical protein COA78_22715 [Blastopirellula sp.]|nr:MAG: hypothetical protein COA78_22715 [Blastopirellula sp.]
MAVEIEFSNVIILKRALEQKYPGGVDAFSLSDIPNYIEDLYLIRVGYMSTAESVNLSDQLKECGLIFDASPESEVAVIDVQSSVDWLDAGNIDNYRCCWLKGSDSGALIPINPGIILRCPRALYDQIEELVATENVALIRELPGKEDYLDPFELLLFSHGEAKNRVGVIGDINNDSSIGLFLYEDIQRRRKCLIDANLTKKLTSLFKNHGAV